MPIRFNTQLGRAASLGLIVGGIALAPALGGCASKSKTQTFHDVPHHDQATGAPEASPATRPAGDLAEATPSTQPAVPYPGIVVVPADDTRPSTTISTATLVRVEEGGAMVRLWPDALVLRPSGDTLAGPNYWESMDKALRRKDLDNLYLEPADFWINLFLMPIRAIITPPWAPMVYSPVGPTGHGPAQKE